MCVRVHIRINIYARPMQIFSLFWDCDIRNEEITPKVVDTRFTLRLDVVYAVLHVFLITWATAEAYLFTSIRLLSCLGSLYDDIINFLPSLRRQPGQDSLGNDIDFLLSLLNRKNTFCFLLCHTLKKIKK